MVWLIRRKDGVSPLFPLRGCFCLDNRLGCFISTATTAITSSISLLFVILDLVSWALPEFIIDPQFPTYWRIRFWKGFILCDIVMFFADLILIIISIIVIVAISWPARYRLYHLKSYLRAWCIIMLLYQITNLGVGVYTYSWYGLAAWRAPYLIFSVMYFIVCYVLYLWCWVTCWSYEVEIDLTLKSAGDDMVVYIYSQVGFLIIGYSYYSEIRLTLLGEGDPEVLQEINFLNGAASTLSPRNYTFPSNQKL